MKSTKFSFEKFISATLFWSPLSSPKGRIPGHNVMNSLLVLFFISILSKAEHTTPSRPASNVSFANSLAFVSISFP